MERTVGWRWVASVTALVASTSALAACGGATAAPLGSVAATQGGIEILEPYLPVPARGRRASVYLTILETGSQPDRLLGVSSPAARSALVVNEVRTGTFRSFGAVASVSVPARGTVRLSPGRLHLVLARTTRALRAGGRIRLVLHFAVAGPLTVEVPVVAAAVTP